MTRIILSDLDGNHLTKGMPQDGHFSGALIGSDRRNLADTGPQQSTGNGVFQRLGDVGVRNIPAHP